MDPIQVRAYRTLDGRPLGRVPAVSPQWGETINEAGEVTCSVPWSTMAAQLDIRELLKPWHTSLAVVRGTRVLQAGPIVSRKWDGAKLEVNAAGMWKIFDKRLVLNRALDALWKNGEVVIDEDNPPKEWTLSLRGSLGDIAAGLIRESLKWGSLPIDLPAWRGGSNVRNYDGWDFAKVSDRLHELTQVQDGPEVAFRPYLTERGYLRWQMACGTPELDEVTWQWKTAAPGQRVALSGVDDDGTDMQSTAYGLGGRKDDIVLASRFVSAILPNRGYPVLQEANTSHSSVSDLGTLNAWLRADVLSGSQVQESTELRISADYDPHPGDHADVYIQDPYLGTGLHNFKIVGVSGDDTEWLTVAVRPRED